MTRPSSKPGSIFEGRTLDDASRKAPQRARGGDAPPGVRGESGGRGEPGMEGDGRRRRGRRGGRDRDRGREGTERIAPAPRPGMGDAPEEVRAPRAEEAPERVREYS